MSRQMGFLGTGALVAALSVGATLALGPVVPAAVVSNRAVSVTMADARPGCWAVNTSRHESGPNLQRLIDRASAGDRIEITGTCAGGFTVRRSITLVGRSTREAPVPTLTGRDQQTVLRMPRDRAGWVVVRGLRVTGGVTDTHGGGIFNRGARLLIQASTVIAGEANKGGGIFSRGGRLTLERTTVRDNTAAMGAGVLTKASPTSIADSTLRSNRATRSGGGALVLEGRLQLTGSTRLIENRARWRGGGVTNRDSLTSISDEVVVGKGYARNGGGVFNLGRLIVGGGSSLTDNTAKWNGGAVHNRPGAVVVLHGHAAVEGNVAGISGGALASFGGRVSLRDAASATRNEARNGGGVATLGGVGTLVVRDDALIAANSAETGGGLSAAGPTVVRGSARIEGNAADNGGGLYDYCRELCTGQELVVRGSARVVDNAAAVDGGGIDSGRGSLILKGHALVARNTAAGQGGGVRDAVGDLEVTDNAEIVANSATDGGGIYATFGARVNLDVHAAVRDNSAVDGGGVHADDLRVRGAATIRDNQADDQGGGVFAFGGTVRVMDVAIIEDNVAGTTGGGVYDGVYSPGDHGTVLLADDALIRANAAETGGGIYLDADRVLTVVGSSTVTENTASVEGGGIFSLGTVEFDDAWTGSVCGNVPDDWPTCTGRG